MLLLVGRPVVTNIYFFCPQDNDTANFAIDQQLCQLLNVGMKIWPTEDVACQTEWSLDPRMIITQPFLQNMSMPMSLDYQVEPLGLNRMSICEYSPPSSRAKLFNQFKPDGNEMNVGSKKNNFNLDKPWCSTISLSRSSTSSPVFGKDCRSSSKSPPSQEKPLTTSLTERRHCVFCKQNGETREFYSSHVLKDAKGKVVCPTLRDYVCPICGATGPNAHTVSYCPSNKEKVENFRSLFNKDGKEGKGF